MSELEHELLTIPQSLVYARKVGAVISYSGLKCACQEGHVPGARKLGRDWVIPYLGLLQYLINRPKRGPKRIITS